MKRWDTKTRRRLQDEVEVEVQGEHEAEVEVQDENMDGPQVFWAGLEERASMRARSSAACRGTSGTPCTTGG